MRVWMLCVKCGERLGGRVDLISLGTKTRDGTTISSLVGAVAIIQTVADARKAQQ